MKRMICAAAVIVAGSVPLLGAHASPCGDKAAHMLRHYVTTSAAPNAAQSGNGGVASANSSRPGAVPINMGTREKVEHMAMKASTSAQAGNEAACNEELEQAEAMTRKN